MILLHLLQLNSQRLKEDSYFYYGIQFCLHHVLYFILLICNATFGICTLSNFILTFLKNL